MTLRILTCVIATLVLPLAAAAQAPKAYVGGTLDLATQTTGGGISPGGTVVGGRALIGVVVSPHVSIEFEPSFAATYSRAYSYRPFPAEEADVVDSRRNMYFNGQVRIRSGVWEPVVGLGYVRSGIRSRATFGGRTVYFDDTETDHGLAIIMGLDAAVPLASHFFFVPTIRVIATVSGSDNSDLRPSDTTTNPLLLRYGAGVRVAF